MFTKTRLTVAALLLSLVPPALSFADPARDAEIARMEALLTVDCGPTQALLSELVAAGRAYRGAISKIERDYAREKDRQVSFLGDFALPTQAPDGLSFRFFTEFSRIRSEADAAGVLGPNDIPDELGLGPLAAAHLNPQPPASDDEKLVRAAAAKIFFDAKDAASAAKLRQTRDDFQTRFEDLKVEYEARRNEYAALFGPDKIGPLNDAFGQSTREGVDPARETYRKLRDQVEELALSRRVEHCLGPIEGDALRTAVGGAVDPFFVQGPDNSVGGIPGMGFVLSAEPRIADFKAEPVPAFGYKFNMKRDPVSFRDFNADINLIKAKASAEQIKIYALFLRDTPLELTVSQDIQTLAKGADKVVAGAKGLAALGERLVVDFGGNPIAMLGEMQIQSFDINADTNASFVEDFGKLKGAFDKAVADIRNGAEAQERLAELGFGNGSIDIDAVEDRFNGLSAEDRSKFGADIAEMLGHVEAGLERTADVQSEILAIIVEEAVTAGISRSVKVIKAFNDGLKTKKALAKLDGALGKIDDAGKRLPPGDEAAKIVKAQQDELQDLRRQTEAAQKKLDDAKADIAEQKIDNPAFRFGDLDGTPPEPPKLNGPDIQLGTATGPDGLPVQINGKELGKGASATAFLSNDVPPKVFRVIPLEIDGVPNPNLLRDNASLKGLLDSGLDSDAVRVIPSEPLKNANVLINGKPAQVQVADLAANAKDQVAKQGGQITKGQATALAKMRAELLNNGVISTDGKLDNLTFINKGGDDWVVGIVDPGGFEKFTGPTAVADAKAFQKAFDGFADSHVADTTAKPNQQFLSAIFDFVAKSDEVGVNVAELYKKNTGLDMSEARFSIPSQRNPNFASQHLPPVDGTPRPPSRQPLDISKEVAEQNRINGQVVAARDELLDVTDKVDAAVARIDELTPGSAANARAAGQVEAAVAESVAAGKNALAELAKIDSQRPGALAAAVTAITDDARQGLIVLSRVAAEGTKEADCVRMRALLAEGDASDDIKELAAEKCGLAVEEAE